MIIPLVILAVGSVFSGLFLADFFIGSDKQILNINRTVILPYDTPYEKSYTYNYQNVAEGVSQILDHEEKLLGQTVFTIK